MRSNNLPRPRHPFLFLHLCIIMKPPHGSLSYDAIVKETRADNMIKKSGFWVNTWPDFEPGWIVLSKHYKLCPQLSSKNASKFWGNSQNISKSKKRQKKNLPHQTAGVRLRLEFWYNDEKPSKQYSQSYFGKKTSLNLCLVVKM